jgi:hypothetical protein
VYWSVVVCVLVGAQYRHYQARLQIFQLNPSEDSKEFAEFITFIAQVGRRVSCFGGRSFGVFAIDVGGRGGLGIGSCRAHHNHCTGGQTTLIWGGGGLRGGRLGMWK